MYDKIKESLDIALDNGYNQIDELAEKVAEDLIRYDEQFEDCGIVDLTGHIRRWQEENGATMKLCGYLKPNGEWIPLEYAEHEAWAIDECEKQGFTREARSQVDVLYYYGYLQISDGNAWFLGGGYRHQTLTLKQQDWLLEHYTELNRESKQTLVDHYEFFLLDTPPTGYSTSLTAPPEYGIRSDND